MVVFVTILMGWSGAAYSAKRAAWTVGLEARIGKARDQWRRVSDWNESERELKYYRLKVEELEALAEQSPYRNAQGEEME